MVSRNRIAERIRETSDVFDQYVEAMSQFELWRGGTGWPYADYYKSLASMRACLGFAKRARYACALSRPREGTVLRTSELP